MTRSDSASFCPACGELIHIGDDVEEVDGDEVHADCVGWDEEELELGMTG